MIPNPKLDGTGFTGKILGMIRRIFGSAIRDTMADVLREPLGKIAGELGELKAGQTRLESRLDDTNQRITEQGIRLDGRINELGARLDTRIDALGAQLHGRMDELSARFDARSDGLDKKIGDLAAQQSRMVEKIADLGGEVAALKRDQKSADVVERRLTRIEDRVFARAG